MKNINIKRLKTALTEYWLLNQTKLVSIPAVVLVLYLLAMFWYGTPLFNGVFLNAYSDNSFVESLANFSGSRTKILVLFTLPLYLVLCTIPYFKILLKTVQGNLSPITRGERMLTLWIGNLSIILLVSLSFFLADWAFVSVMKALYLSDVIAYKESIGELYYKFNDKSYFAFSVLEDYAVTIVASLVFVCLYQLASTFFRRYSIPLFIMMMILLGVVYYKFILLLYQHSDHRFDGSDLTANLIKFYVIVGMLALIVTTYFKLKEKEIY